jgi:hypothetical protein
LPEAERGSPAKIPPIEDARPISLRETTGTSPASGELQESLALRVDTSRRVMLRFALDVPDQDALEALRYARRSMIREERTRGLEWDEPSMEDPTLSGTEIRWFVLAAQATWGRRKLTELVDRANRALVEIRAGRTRYRR